MFHVKQSEDFSKIFHGKQKTQQNNSKKNDGFFPNLVAKNRIFHKKLLISEKTEKNREKLKKMLAFPCFLCYNH